MRVNGYPLVCPHCKGHDFLHKLVPINSDAIPIPHSLRKGDTADAFTCKQCQRTEWFVDAVVDFDERSLPAKSLRRSSSASSSSRSSSSSSRSSSRSSSSSRASSSERENRENSCPRCGGHVSKNVTVCPSCGKRMRSPNEKSPNAI